MVQGSLPKAYSEFRRFGEGLIMAGVGAGCYFSKMNDVFSTITWPALAFGAPECSMFRHNSATAFYSVTPRTLKKLGAMRYYFLVDSCGRQYDLRNPRFLSPPPLLGKLISNVLEVKRPVVWEKSDAGVRSIDEIKVLIKKDFDEYGSVWEAYDIKSLRDSVERSSTIRELMDVF